MYFYSLKFQFTIYMWAKKLKWDGENWKLEEVIRVSEIQDKEITFGPSNATTHNFATLLSRTSTFKQRLKFKLGLPRWFRNTISHLSMQ